MNYDINNLESIKIKGYKNFWKVSTKLFSKRNSQDQQYCRSYKTDK
jgi:hypothetical protein